MRHVHKVKCKDLIKRQGRESVCFTCFNMSLADTHCLLHEAEENRVYCVQKNLDLSKERREKSTFQQKVRKFLSPHKTTESQFDMRQNRHFLSKLANRKFGDYETELCRNTSYLTIQDLQLG